ncbi:triple tyrosine motif-containing protein [Reichenbachiella versicolor]|uniref:triple tyrosine motif-containing protein n=1 Tax=Reichenbachiella versicolor TaxID=1821036 RepID=UPI0013A5BBC6|nr:triple tyrosine motif-containing protein [Reichenbachiella versicolor]
MPRFIIAFLLTSLPLLVFSQQGDLFLTHHNLDIPGLDNTNFQIITNNHGQLCIANRSGILQYDGTHWDYISTPSAAVSIAFDDEDNLYVGCVGDFGIIDFQDNQYKFVSLNPNKKDDGIYFQTVFMDTCVFFMSEENIIRYNLAHKRSSISVLDNMEEFYTKVFAIDSTILVQTNDSLYQYKNDSLLAFDWNQPKDAKFIFFNKHPTENKYVCGTTDNKTYIYREGKFYQCRISKFLSESESFVDNGMWVDERYFALSTLENGVILYDNKRSRIVEVINQSKGLPDNEVRAIGVDKEEGLWISHEFGLSRMEIDIPFRSFTNFQGLHGNLYEAYFHKKNLYVATSEGVFHLIRQKRYKNIVYYSEFKNKNFQEYEPEEPEAEIEGALDEEVVIETEYQSIPVSKRLPKTEIKKSSNPEGASESNTTTPNKKSFFSRLSSFFSGSDDSSEEVQTIKIDTAALIRKHKRSKKSSETIYEPQERITITAKNKKYRRVKRQYLDSRYYFKHVDGIHAKTEKFFVYQGNLYAAGTNGVYEIKNDKAELVIHEPVRFITPEKKHDKLIVGNLYNEVKIYHKEGNIWEETENLNMHGDLVMTAFNDQSGRTWFVTPTALIEFDDITVDHFEYKLFKYKNQFIDKTKLAYVDSILYLINSEGYFYLDPEEQIIKEDTAILNQIGKPIRHLQQRDGVVWINNGQNWFKIDHDRTIEEMDVFGLFPNMTYISKYGSRHWLIDDSKEVLQFDKAILDSLHTKSKMFFRKVSSNKGDVKLSETMYFDFDENSIDFELSKPDYRGILSPVYRYKLSGANESWSEWSHKYHIMFNYLPPGHYTLLVQAHDSFDNLEESKPIHIIIRPPFWQTLWFYGLQILFMTSLVVASAFMNRKAQTKYVIVTEALTIITLVMIIEFLQTVAGNYLDIQSSPVVDFGIDVIIALCVFPLEQLLKKYLKADGTGDGVAGKGLLDILKLTEPIKRLTKKDL